MEKSIYKIWHNGLLGAIQRKDVEGCLDLIERGAPLDMPDENGQLPINLLPDVEMQEVALAMVRHGSPLNHPDKDKQLPIEWAASQGLTEVVELMLQHGSPVRKELRAAARKAVLGGGMVKEFVTRVVVPVLFENAPESLGSFAKSDLNKLIDDVTKITGEIICGPVSYATIDAANPQDVSRVLRPLRLLRSWEHPPVFIPADKLPSLTDRQWHGVLDPEHPLFHASNGLVVRELTSSQELIEEGRKMRHCSGRIGLEYNCCENGEHVFAICSPSGKSIATVHCKPGGMKDPGLFFLGHEGLVVEQHRGEHNNAPPLSAFLAFEEFKEAAYHNELKFNKESGELDESKKRHEKIPMLERTIGYKPTTKRINAVFDEYKKDMRRTGVGVNAHGKMLYDPVRQDFIQGYGEVRDGVLTGRFYANKDDIPYFTKQVQDVRELDALGWMQATSILGRCRAYMKTHHYNVSKKLEPVWKEQDARLKEMPLREPPRQRIICNEAVSSPLQRKKDKGHFVA